LRWRPFELHPETPPEGAPKPFPPEQWPAVRARLVGFAEAVGLPIDPPQRNVNSRFALETGELIRASRGDVAANAFHHQVASAFFVDQADISRPEIVFPIARLHGVGPAEAEQAWAERRFSAAVDGSMQAAFAAGVSGVPAMGWPGRLAIVGMREPDALVAFLSDSKP